MFALFAILHSLTPSAEARGGIEPQLVAAQELVWLGLDFSRVRIFTPEQFTDPDERVFWDPGGGLGDTVTRFKNPEAAFDQLVSDWNSMAVHDHVEDLEKALEREILVDLPSASGQTNHKGDRYFESVYDAKDTMVELNQAVIQDMVKKYRVKSRKGVGFVFIMDRFSHPDKEACVWPTFFDLSNKVVFHTERICKKPGGSGYRNYWFNVIPSIVKDMVKDIKRDEY
jgi:hypothetical protein